MPEVKIEDEIRIDAAPSEVWRAIKDPDTHARWHPFVTAINGEHALGRVRRCSVIIGKKTGQTTERCAEEEQASRITWAIEEDSTGFGRMVSGWRAGFALQEGDNGTLVTAYSTFQPNNLLVRAMTPIIRSKFHKTERTILAGLKESLPGTRTTPAGRRFFDF